MYYLSKYIIYKKGEGSGDKASSKIRFDDYSYTHGGSVFREAVDWCKEILKHLSKFRAAKDSKISQFAESLEYNNQITRFFDGDLVEYDQTSVNAEIEREGKIYVLQWTSPEGYECIYEYN